MKKGITHLRFFPVWWIVGILFFLTFTIGCKKMEKEAPKPSVQNADTAKFTDPVNKDVYKIVKIGNQWWMAENLKAVKYRNGQYIAYIANNNHSDTTRWTIDTTGAYCFYNNDFTTTSGALYNWYAVNNPNQLAPAGWHIASDEEWKTLEKYLGMSASDADNINWRGTIEGDKLKVQYPIGWTQASVVYPTNESGFTALPGSCRVFNSIWGNLGIGATGYWWTSTSGASSASSHTACYRYLDYKTSQVFRNYVSKNYGFSVRCVKD